MMNEFNRMGDRWVKLLKPLAESASPFKMADILCRTTLDVIGKVGWNKAKAFFNIYQYMHMSKKEVHVLTI